MRIIKNLALLLFLTLFISCSDDDDASNVSDDPIVGEWRLESISLDGTSIELQECQDLETYFFNEDFSFRAEAFEFNTIVEDCVLNAFTEGAWGILESGGYFTNTTGTQNNFNASFLEEENVLRITSSDPLSGLQENREYRRQ